MKIHKWNDVKRRRLSPEQIAAVDAQVAADILEMNLKEVRELLGKTQEQLAAVANIDQSQLSRTERREDHLVSTLRQYIEALGGELEVPTLGGRIKLKIPVETQSGKLFRLRGKGVRSVRSSSKGDLFCRAVVETPVNLTKEQKEILKDLERTMGEGGTKHSPQTSSWLNGVKKFFDDMTN